MNLTFWGMMNVRNEALWIKEVVQSMLPLCDLVFILDDHSTDGTLEICRDLGPQVRVFPSPFPDTGRDKARDKNFIYAQVRKVCAQDFVNESSPYWVLAIDGDEVLPKGAAEVIRKEVGSGEQPHSWAFQVLYLWDSDTRVRYDRVYNKIFRPSLFRVINPIFVFNNTPFGGNSHCPNVPQDLIHGNRVSRVKLKHYGYRDKERRIRKWMEYIQVDPGNEGEDWYRHVVQGDVPSIPSEAVLKHAGPMEFSDLDSLGYGD